MIRAGALLDVACVADRLGGSAPPAALAPASGVALGYRSASKVATSRWPWPAGPGGVRTASAVAKPASRAASSSGHHVRHEEARARRRSERGRDAAVALGLALRPRWWCRSSADRNGVRSPWSLWPKSSFCASTLPDEKIATRRPAPVQRASARRHVVVDLPAQPARGVALRPDPPLQGLERRASCGPGPSASARRPRRPPAEPSQAGGSWPAAASRACSSRRPARSRATSASAACGLEERAHARAGVRERARGGRSRRASSCPRRRAGRSAAPRLTRGRATCAGPRQTGS